MSSPGGQRTVRILGIESSCDETAAAIVEDGRKILSNVIATQIELHKKYGGVFPEVASRQHVLNVSAVVEEAMAKAHASFKDLDAIAVTRGPGLAGSLVVGVNAAKGLALTTGLPLLGINHLEAHIYSAWLHEADDPNPSQIPEFPLITLIVSGGHSEIVLMKSHMQYERLGGTLDDAAGEAFDKAARLIGLEYPGGPSIQKAAIFGDSSKFTFPRSRLDGSWDFSFSGVKTAVLRKVRELEKESPELPVADLAAGFQESIVSILFEKTMAAAQRYKANGILIVGGVSANQALRDLFLNQNIYPVLIPKMAYCTDNAAMVAAAGFHRFEAGNFDELGFDVFPTWPLSRVNLQTGN